MRRKPSPSLKQQRDYRCAERKGEKSIRERLGNPGQPVVDGRDLLL